MASFKGAHYLGALDEIFAKAAVSIRIETADRVGQTFDFMLAEHPDTTAAQSYLIKA
ncbi:hypothetical protein [uncultured Sulfitobacter sp.]|jgi:hypothetical protein|uniref:hypothetical protein n=1 Tax=uncultured Sulfitobacter sp. TaxID=191468 RepID=UPI0030DD479B|tara:strand:- start:595 stop:765 length:171 start_codon:yes stop_codon:yes gene_type:complete